MKPVHVIGGGLAGSEAAWQIANRGIGVVIHEMRPVRMTAAHKTQGLAELVCSNSFRSDDRDTNDLTTRWREQLFGDDGTLVGLLAGAGSAA